MARENYIKYLSEKCVESGEIEGHKYFILVAPMEGVLNGYLVFDKKPVREDGYNGILSYVPVHGGITLCEHQKEGSVYGFDTLHYNSQEFPRTDPDWIKEQIVVMLKGIQVAAKVESKYLKALTNKTKAKWAQLVQDVQPEQGQNFGVMINLLSGKL